MASKFGGYAGKIIRPRKPGRPFRISPDLLSMRHKLLSFLEEALKDGELLEGIVETDEAYVLESQKGIPVTTRKPRKHGESTTKRGLSDEHFSVCVAADRDRLCPGI